MKRLVTISFLVVLSSLTSGCSFICWLCELGKGTSPVSVASGPPILFSGHIVSNFGGAVAGATVDVNGDKTLSKADGSFTLFAKVAGRYTINIEKDGFALLSRVTEAGLRNQTFTMTKATVQHVDPTIAVLARDNLSREGCRGSINGMAKIDWETVLVGDKVAAAFREQLEKNFNQPKLCSPGIEIAIPANSLVDDKGLPPIGPVTISLATADLYARDGMPGDFTVVGREEGTIPDVERFNSKLSTAPPRYSFMESYGAGSIRVTADGKSYQPKPGTVTTMNIPIDPNRLKVLQAQGQEPDPTIPLMFYDEKSGFWYIDGNASLNGSKDAYIAKLSHFSWVNIDKEKVRPRCIKFDSASMPGTFTLSISFPGFANDRSVTNSPSDHIHAVTRLPENTDVTLTAFETGTSKVIAILPTTNTDSWPLGTTPVPFPSPPYNECVNAGNLYQKLEDVNKPTLTVTKDPAGFLTASWDGKWSNGIVPHSDDGYVFEESKNGGPWHVVQNDATLTDVFPTSAGPVGVQNDRAPKSNLTFGKKIGEYKYRVKAFYGALPGADPTNNAFYKISDPVDVAVVDSRLAIVNHISGVTNTDVNVLRLRIAPVADLSNPSSSPPASALTNGNTNNENPVERLPVDSTCDTFVNAANQAPIMMYQIAPTNGPDVPHYLVTNLDAPHYDIYLELGFWKESLQNSTINKIYPNSNHPCYANPNPNAPRFYSKQLYDDIGTVPPYYHRRFGAAGYIRVQKHLTGDLTLIITGTADNPVISSATYVLPSVGAEGPPTFVTVPMLPIGVKVPLQTVPTPDPITGTY